MATLMVTPDELALKQQVTDTLAREGVLAKIKAELRAAVFRVMHERAVPLAADAFVPKLSAFPDDVAGTAVELIAECLAFFQWDHSLLVLRAEADLETRPLTVDSEKLAHRLQLDGVEAVATPSAPVLLQLVEERLAGKSDARGGSRKSTPSFGGVVEISDAERVTPSSFRSEREQHEHLEERLEDEEAEMEEDESFTERAVEQRLDAPDGLARDSAPQSGKDEGDDGSVRALEEEPRGGTGKFVQHDPDDDCSDGEEEYTTSRPRQDASLHAANDEEEEEEEEEMELEESMAEDFASGSEYEESRELVSPVPLARRAEEEGSDAGDQEDDRALLPPPVPTRLAPSHPLESLAPSTAPGHDSDASARDDESDAEDEAARLSSLDAKLKAMEAEDDTGTLQQLKASLQLELQRGDESVKGGEDEDGDGDGYGSSDFEEEEVASEVSEEVESMAEASDNEEDAEGDASSERELSKPAAAVVAPVPAVLMADRAVESEDALNSYDYVEAVERPW